MRIKNKFTQKLPAIAAVCLLWLFLLCILLSSGQPLHTATAAMQSSPPERGSGLAALFESKSAYTPKQDADGYYLLSTIDDFNWFISMVNSGNAETNVRLCNDLILNDTSDWESWADTPPENIYHPMGYYNGHFDGGGFALDGYYSSFEEDEPDLWQVFLFTCLEENARISDLGIRNSFFRTTYDACVYEDDDGGTDVVPAAALCFSNEGVIENCSVHAKVMGAWSAGGIAVINYGQMIDCHFTGSVEAGLAYDTAKPDTRLGSDTLYAGGICRGNQGLIRDCVNDGSILLHSLPEDYYMTYTAGGIAGRTAEESIIEDSENNGAVTCPQLAGGIAGANWGGINRCINRGDIHVEEASDLDHTESLICAGICASNGGVIDTCIHTGSATIHQTIVSFYAPICGIACNIINPSKGTVTNCYYVNENTDQAYRQSGVHKLPAADTADLSPYLDGTRKIKDVENWNLLPDLPLYPGTDEDDYIHLYFGPAEDVVYEVQPGDSLWRIAEKFYGDGRYYDLLAQEAAVLPSASLFPGDRLTIPRKDFYLLRANDEQGHGWSACMLSSGETCPTYFNAAKPIDWYYGSMNFAAHSGFDVMWPKDKEQGHDVPASDIRIMYRMDGNPEGNFFADWDAAQKNIRGSAKACCGDAVDNLRFYCYTLDNGEKLYGFSFRLYRSADTLQCAAFYRISDGLLAEYIGVAPIQEKEPVLERVRYLAAEITTDDVLTTKEVQSDCETFYGRENWDFPLLHNPFATALAYDKDAKCSSYMLFTGAQ